MTSPMTSMMFWICLSPWRSERRSRPGRKACLSTEVGGLACEARGPAERSHEGRSRCPVAGAETAGGGGGGWRQAEAATAGYSLVFLLGKKNSGKY